MTVFSFENVIILRMKIKRKTYNKIKKYSLITLCILILVGIFYSIFWTNFIKINNFVVEYDNQSYTNYLENELNKTLNEKYLKFIPKNNLLTYSGSEIKNITKKIITNAKSISIHPSSLHTVKIKITTYTPVFRLNNNEVIAMEGKIYEELNYINDLPVFIASSTPNINLINNILDLKEKINKVLFNINQIEINQDDNIIFANKDLDQKITFKKESDFKKIWSTLISAIDTDPLKQKLKNEKKNSYYIDLRIDNKVFYKFWPKAKHDIIAPNNYENATNTESN